MSETQLTSKAQALELWSTHEGLAYRRHLNMTVQTIFDGLHLLRQ
jgi:hypothetical protein